MMMMTTRRKRKRTKLNMINKNQIVIMIIISISISWLFIESFIECLEIEMDEKPASNEQPFGKYIEYIATFAHSKRFINFKFNFFCCSKSKSKLKPKFSSVWLQYKRERERV